MKLATTIFIACTGLLMALGMVMLYSAGMGQAGARYVLMQFAWGLVGLGACLTMVMLDYRWLKKYSWLWYLLAVILLVLVLIPHIGVSVKGARRWIDLRVVRFQPSELAKIALLIALAHYGEFFHKRMRNFVDGLVGPSVLLAVILLLIFKEPDWGTTILLTAVCSATLLLAGTRWIYFVPIIPATVGILGYLLVNNPTRLDRVMAWLHPEAYRDGSGYQVCQSLLAFGSGGWFGLGLGNGRQKLGFVPEHHTDFILSIIGEELGVIATLGVLLAFIALVICGAYIARHATDHFGFLLGSGITLMIGCQAFINIGVVTGVLPNKGLPLPLVSYGGSNLVMNLVAVGILLSIACRARENVAAEDSLLSEPVPVSLPF